ncbi:MAG: ParA family protein [Thermoguttaceae bacterium]|nr:ParA family protein [Thermoguttaceae bacterium]
MGRILCIANQKGGVGKTTTAINLAAALARAGCRTLVVDFDPQCNATSGLGCRPLMHHPLARGQAVQDAIVRTSVAGLDLLPGTRGFRDVERLARDPTLTPAIRDQLRLGVAGYDFVLIDCPPSLGQLTRTALASADEVLMPIQCEYFAMEGLAQMIEVIRQVMHTEAPKLQFAGILLTMYDHTLELTLEVEREVRDFFGEIVFHTVIPRDVALAEAPSHGLTILDYAPRSRGARAYAELSWEVRELG